MKWLQNSALHILLFEGYSVTQNKKEIIKRRLSIFHVILIFSGYLLGRKNFLHGAWVHRAGRVRPRGGAVSPAYHRHVGGGDRWTTPATTLFRQLQISTGEDAFGGTGFLLKFYFTCALPRYQGEEMKILDVWFPRVPQSLVFKVSMKIDLTNILVYVCT